MVTYTWICKQGVRSSEGLEVQYTGRFDMEIRWGRRKSTIYVEGVARPEGMDEAHFERWDNSSAFNDRSERMRILSAVRAALDFMSRNEPPK
jgi:hypothetical protein